MVKAHDYQEFKDIINELRERRKEVPKENKLGWYIRYQKKAQKQPLPPL